MRRPRILASVAATVIALACGTNYVYSAWAPQFAKRLKLTATQSNTIGLFGNLGMYSLGPLLGMFVDHPAVGSRPAVLLSAVMLGAGYFPLHQAYDSKSGSVPVLCFFSYLTGVGSCLAFLTALKVSALNWPHHRGTATAFPLAAFGLSAFFFSLLGSIFFPGDPSSFLNLLAWGTVTLFLVSFVFLKAYPHTPYQPVPSVPDVQSDIRRGKRPRRTSSAQSSRHLSNDEPDIRGFQLLACPDFWKLFTIMTILAGAGLMTINNIGNDANVLWKHFDSSKEEEYLVHRQQMHVSILSVGNFAGRLLSGIGSDFLIKQLGVSRIWCLATSGLIFTVAQICGYTIATPTYLFLLSSLTGIGYGLLFGVFPSIVAETFGIHGLSQNWGFITLAPVLSSNIFNLIYGSILDTHSVLDSNGERACHEGLECYRSAYGITLASCLVGVGITIWVIRHQYIERIKLMGKANLED